MLSSQEADSALCDPDTSLSAWLAFMLITNAATEDIGLQS